MTDIIINFLHLLATAVWIGGASYAHLILMPSLKEIDPQQGGKLLGVIAKRFSITAWSAIIILIITGLLKTPREMLFEMSSDTGIILTIKHVLVLSVVVVGLVIALVVVPRMRRSTPGQGEAPSAGFIKYQRRLHNLAATNLISGVLIVLFASMLW
jgi:uncharacterized membrane protein